MAQQLKGTCSSLRGPRFGSHQPMAYSSSQLCLQVQSRGPDALLWYQVHMRGTDIYIGKTPIQNKVFFKKRKKKILCDAKSLEAKDEDEKG